MKKKTIETLIAIDDHYNKWFKSLKDAQEIVPLVKHQQEITQWQIAAIKDSPTDSIDTNVIESINNEYTYTVKALPLSHFNISTVASGTSTCASYLVDYITRIGNSGTPKNESYAVKYLRDFQKIQRIQDRPNETRDLIVKLDNTNTLNRFDEAIKSCALLKAGLCKRATTATHIRNLIDGVKGDIYRMVFSDNENKSWTNMAKKLSKGLEESKYKILLDQERIHSSLYDRISKILKNREPKENPDEINNLWSEVLEHIYATLTIVLK